MKYQIYCDRGNGPELSGCWGSEHAAFKRLRPAVKAARHLAKLYGDCAWVVCEINGRTEREVRRYGPRIEAAKPITPYANLL